LVNVDPATVSRWEEVTGRGFKKNKIDNFFSVNLPFKVVIVSSFRIIITHIATILNPDWSDKNEDFTVPFS